MRSSNRCQSLASSSMMRLSCEATAHQSAWRGRSAIPCAGSGDLVERDPALQQEGTNLFYDAGALADQPLTHPMRRLQVELLGCLGGDEFHRRPLHRLGDGFRVAEVVLLSLTIRAHIFGGISRPSWPRNRSFRLGAKPFISCTAGVDDRRDDDQQPGSKQLLEFPASVSVGRGGRLVRTARRRCSSADNYTAATR
jgi:hypothetical protein